MAERAVEERVIRAGAFDRGAVGVALWITLGAHLDAWAHNHGKTDQTFFTPWHALLYSGMAAGFVYFGTALVRGGVPVLHALPRGYRMSFAGVLSFGVFGVLDLGWHSVFGIEAETAALLSPSHLGLMCAGFMIAAGPWAAARSRGDTTAGWPVVCSAALALSGIWFWAQFDLPQGHPWAALDASDEGVVQGVYAIVVATGTIVGFLLFLLRDFTLPPGAVTVLIAVPAMLDIAVVGPGHPLAQHLAVLAGGVTADVVLRLAGPRRRAAVTAIPVALWTIYFAVLAAGPGIVWEVHVWTGAIAISGITAYLISLLAFPPPTERPL